MSLPGNGIFVVQGEMAMLVTAMRRSTRWGSHSFPNDEYDVLMRTFQDLKTILNQVDDLRLLDPSTYLSPFLEVIRSKETTGPVTSLALSSIHKFLSYGLIDPTHPSVPATVEDIADAVTHARFVGTDHSSDGVVLLKILQVLRTLMLSSEGAMLTDESVCEIMLSCFRTCFETRLTELLRRNAEQCLRDMTQLIFMRLPQFPTEDATTTFSTFGFSLKRRDKSTKKKITSAHSTNSLDRKSSLSEHALSTADADTEHDQKPSGIPTHNQDKNLLNEAEITIEPVEEVKSPKKHNRHSSMDLAANENKSITQLLEKCVGNAENGGEHAAAEKNPEKTEEDNGEVAEGKWDGEYRKDKNLLNEAEITIEPVEEVKSPKKHNRHSSMDLAANENKSITQLLEKCVSNAEIGGEDAAAEKNPEKTEEDNGEVAEGKWDGEYRKDKNLLNEAEITIEPVEEVKSPKKHNRHSSMDLAANENKSITQLLEKCVGNAENGGEHAAAEKNPEKTEEDNGEVAEGKWDGEYRKDKNLLNEAEITIEPVEEVKSPKKHNRHSSMDLAANENKSITQLLEKCVGNAENGGEHAAAEKNPEKTEEDNGEVAEGKWDGEYRKDKNLLNEAEITIEPVEEVKSPKKHNRHSSMDLAANENKSITQLLEKCVGNAENGGEHAAAEKNPEKTEEDNGEVAEGKWDGEYRKDKNLLNEAEITIEPVEEVKSPKKHNRHSSMDLAANENKSITQLLEKCVSNAEIGGEDAAAEKNPEKTEEDNVEVAEEPKQPTEPIPEAVKDDPQPEGEKLEEYVNHRGIRFTPQDDALHLQPYGLACVRELFRFLISLCNPLDAQNTSAMVHLGLSLVGTALEVGADQIAKYPSLLYLVQDPLCRNLLSLLDTEKITIFALDLQLWFLLFEALRVHLKYQMEAFFKKIIEIISADTTKSIYELKEIHHIALENLAQMFRIPGLCTELYLNFDCDIYCVNVFEELAKLLSKNVVSSTAYNIHTMSLEALMTIIEAIEMGTMQKVEIENQVEEEKEKDVRSGHVCLELGGMDDSSVVSDHVTHDIREYFGSGRTGRHKASLDLPTEAELDNVKNLKKWITQGTELFNQKPERGIEFLQEHGIFSTPLDPHKVALFLRENPDLDKKMIGEYICKRSSRGEDGGPSILGAFADSFDYAGLRLDQALRLYLETFRLPGEAPLISLVMEKFAERWHSTNGEPFANTDAAFRLAYAVIMLNVDQHNHNAKKLNVPMTVEDFVRNLRGCNGADDFDQAMLEDIFHSIKEKEMVMPAERVGPLRDAYLWRVLQRRGRTPAARYRLAPPPPHALHARLLPAACPPAVTALSASFERSSAPTPEEIESNNLRDCAALIALNGLERCAALVARLSSDTLTLDTLLLTLCKFTGLLTPQHASYIAIGVSLGQSSKAQISLRRACAVAARHADYVRDSWRHLLEILNTLYIGRLLPKSLVEAEDYLSPEGKVSLIREAARGDSGLLSSIYSYIALGESGIRAPTPHEKSLIDAAAECVAKCNLHGLLVTETRFLQLESLQELIRAMVAVGVPPDTDSMQLNPQLEDITIFFLELLGQTLIQNRDRIETVWPDVGPHIERVVFWAGGCGAHALTRALTALLRTSARLMRCEQCAPLLLRYLTLLYRLPYKLFYQQADVISSGLYELVKTSAQNVHSASEWGVLLALLAAAGAGAWPRGAPASAYTAGSSRSEGSEDDSERQPTSVSSESELSHSPQTQGWILVKNETASATETVELELEQVSLRPHRSTALARCVEALALVIRDVAHVTPHNCRAAVRCVRLMAKAVLQSGRSAASKDDRRGSTRRRARRDSSDEEVDTQDHYHVVSIKLLDLMHTLHSRTAQIYKWWRDEADQGQGAEDYDLWEVAWKPLLQGIAEFCTENRGKKGGSSALSYSAIAYLQRALLAPALSALGGAGWEACFEHVLLPLLSDPPRRPDAAARADTVMCKVFLQHLPALVGRPSFAALWSRIIRVQRALLASPAEPLREAALESLKNMLLVMHSVKIFSSGDGYNELWYITWDIIAEFLPNLKQELFPDVNDNTKPQQSVPSHMQPSIPPLPAIVPVGANSMPNPTNTTNPTSPSTAPSDANNLSTNLTNPQRSNVQSPNILLATAHSPVNLPQSPPISGPPLVSPIPITAPIPNPTGMPTGGVPMPMSTAHTGTSNPGPISPGLITPMPNSPAYRTPGQPTGISPGLAMPMPMSGAQTAGLTTPMPVQPGVKPAGLTSPVGKPGANVTPVSGMVPIRNPLYDQSGLTSSVLLQPLNEMISTPIGISIQSQPTIQPTSISQVQPSENEPNPVDIESTITTEANITDEIYAEYITNPYNDFKELSSKEATLYDPEENRRTPDQTVQDRLLTQKSFSANVTPMHTKNKAQFSSTDNVRQEGIFNFSSYFGSNEKSADVFDVLMSTNEG